MVHLTRFAFNHCPFLVTLDNVLFRRVAPFIIQKFWLLYEGIYEVVKQAWVCEDNCSLSIKLSKLLQKLRGLLGEGKLELVIYSPKDQSCMICL